MLKKELAGMMIDVVEPDKGTIRFWGEGLNEPASTVKQRIGVLPEFNPIIDEFSIQDYLKYVGLIYNLDDELLEKRSEFLIKYFFEEVPSKKKIIGSFSKGMKMKTGICAALIHKPELLILDEPFDGMDIFSANHLVSFLNDYKQKGNTIFVSSHEKRFGEGRILISAIGNDPGWSNFGVKPLYAPFYYRSLLYVASSIQGGLVEHILGEPFNWKGNISSENLILSFGEDEIVPEIKNTSLGVEVNYDAET